MPATVLIVDDESSIVFSLEEALSDANYRVITAATGEKALREAKDSSPDIVLLDMKLPDIDGLKVLKQIKSINPDIPVIMMSAYADVPTAIQATKHGALNFIEKPLNIEKIKIDIQNSIELEQYKGIEQFRFRQKLANPLDQDSPLDQILGNSIPIKTLKDTIKKIVESKATTVLIQGESGTGKELVARAIHYASNRCNKPFVDINCTSIADTLLESELFGHVKGAYTDAKNERKGLFELSDGGTLFLDEIGDMKMSMQAKLLRVLQERCFTRVGGSKKIYVDVRIVAATNKDLENDVQEGLFREDLYYRLNVVPIYCPPLRERGEDIIVLAKFFMDHFNRDFNKNVSRIHPQAEQILLSYHWPGNVRELKNVIERAILLHSEDVLLPEHLDISRKTNFENIRNGEQKPAENTEITQQENNVVTDIDEITLDEMEKMVIQRSLSKFNWNKNLVAKKLGINRTTLYTKIKKYNLEQE